MYTLSIVMNRYIVFIFTLTIAMYLAGVEHLPKIMQIPYEWHATNVRQKN